MRARLLKAIGISGFVLFFLVGVPYIASQISIETRIEIAEIGIPIMVGLAVILFVAGVYELLKICGE